jgi:hypothetical protein
MKGPGVALLPALAFVLFASCTGPTGPGVLAPFASLEFTQCARVTSGLSR